VMRALARLLTAERVRAYAAVFLILGMVALAAVVTAGDPPLDAGGTPIAVDFSAHYTAGRMALGGELDRLHDPLVQRSHQRDFLGRGPEWDTVDLYLSPPFMAWVYAPFAALPYLPAAALWVALSAGMLVWALRLLWPLVPGLHRHGFGRFALVALSAQPVLELLGDGQDSAVGLLLVVGALRLLEARRDLAAGCLIGLGAFKPQLVFLLPVLLLVERRWRALAGAAAVALVLVVVSALSVGLDGLTAYVALLAGGAYRQQIRVEKMVSLPALARTLLPATRLGAALVGTAIAAALAAMLALAARKAPAQPARFRRLYAIAVVATLLASPHLFLYDCVLLFVPAAILLDAGDRDDVQATLAILYLLLWTTPLRIALTLGRPPLWLIGAPWAALGLLAMFWVGRRVVLAPQDEFKAALPS
jgi:hypothetical protein